MRVNDETYPLGSMTTFHFPARDDKAALKLVWYDGVMSLKPSRYEPPSPSIDHRKWKDRFLDWVRGPFPIRVEVESQFRWVVDSFVVLALWLAGTLAGGAFAELTPFLRELAYPVGLIVGWFPIGMWMHYCRVSSDNAWSSVLLIAGLLTLFAIPNGLRGVLLWPLGCGFLLVVLPLELALGKVVFSRLPSSSINARIRAE